MSTFAVILPAAGRSTRFGDSRRKKPFVELAGRPVWVRAVEAFVNREDVVQTIVAVSAEDVDWFKERFRPNLVFMEIEVACGGAERAETVERALSLVRDDVEFVAVHDAARPLVTSEWVGTVFEAAIEHGAALPVTATASTLKRVESGRVVETVDRTGLHEAQTPQVFRRELLVEAYAQRGDFVATDDAQLVERLGHAVHVVDGWPINRKITTRADFELAVKLVEALPTRPTSRPLHPFADEEPRSLS